MKKEISLFVRMSNRFLSFVMLALLATSAFAQDRIDLSGEWQSSLGKVNLPGSLLTNNLGDAPSVHTQWTGSLYDSSFYFNPYMEKYRQEGKMKFPFFLTPNKHYVGHVIYSKSIEIPKAWKGRRVILNMERPHIETTLKINGQEMGRLMSLSVPHEYDITNAVVFGKANLLEVDVYNGIENVCVGQDSHSVTDQTQGNWNGIVGKIELLSCSKKGTWPYRVRTFADLQTGNVNVVVNADTFRLHIDHPVAWSEFTPVIYHRKVSYQGTEIPVSFGFRKIKIKGRQFFLNGQPIWIRGTVGNCNFPLTGYPPTDIASWMTIIRKCKDYGLNAMRFHSYCPPEAAFIAADSLGFYLQPEGPSWPNHGVKLSRGMYIDTYLMEETKRIVDVYGNHPSFVMMAAGNEPAGDWVSWCNKWVDEMKRYDDRHVYCGASVGGGWAWDEKSEYHVKGGARGLDWDNHAPHSDDNYYDQILCPRNYKGKEPNESPVIAHEQGQWCAFPDLDERKQYTGVYQAKNFDIFEDLLRDHGMQEMAGKFLHASSKLQWLAYKYEMERNFRTKDYAGFLLLGLNDYSGQGTALVGPLNVFWHEKGNPSKEEKQRMMQTWRESCNDAVILAKFPKFVYSNADTLNVNVEMYHAGKQSIQGAEVSWKVESLQEETPLTIFSSGILQRNRMIPLGKNIEMGQLSLPLNTISKPTKMMLSVECKANGMDMIRNHWNFWVYPVLPDMKEKQERNFLVTDTLDARAVKVLQKGGKVLILAAGKVRYGSDVKQTYLPVFWNTSWFKMRPPHTTGATIDNQHPLFKEFPSDDWANLNWWELLNKSQVMNLAEFPNTYQSPIQPIDTWHVSRKLGMLIEANVAGGRLLMTTMDLTSHLETRIVARQMRKAILDYMKSDDFKPILNIDLNIISDLFEKQAPAVNMFTNDSPDELKPKLK